MNVQPSSCTVAQVRTVKVAHVVEARHPLDHILQQRTQPKPLAKGLVLSMHMRPHSTQPHPQAKLRPHAQVVVLEQHHACLPSCQRGGRPLERERVKALSVQLRTEVERWLCCVSGAAMQLGLHVLLAFKMSTYGTSYRASISSTVSRGTLSLPSCPGWLESSAHISSNARQRPNIAVPVSLAMAACTRCLERCRQAGRPAGGVGCPRNRTHRCQHSRDRWWAPSSHSSAGSPLVLERHVGGEEGVARVYQLRKGAQVGLHAVHLNAALGGLDGRRHLQSK